jgi:hypothetical protein
MEAFLSLAFGLPSGSHFSVVFRVVNNLSKVLLSLKGKGGVFCDVPCSSCGVLFLNVVWFSIKSIVKLITFSLHVAFHLFLFPFWFSLPLMA